MEIRVHFPLSVRKGLAVWRGVLVNVEAIGVAPEHPPVIEEAVRRAEHRLTEQTRKVLAGQLRPELFVPLVRVFRNPENIDDSVGVIHRLHVRPDHHARQLVDRLPPDHSLGAIGLQPGHERVVLSRPDIPPVREIHLHAAGFVLMVAQPLLHAFLLKLDRSGVREIDDLFSAVFHGTDRQEALGRQVDPAAACRGRRTGDIRHPIGIARVEFGKPARRASAGAVQREAAAQRPACPPVESLQAVFLEESPRTTAGASSARSGHRTSPGGATSSATSATSSATAATAAARHPGVEPAVVGRHPLAVFEVDWLALLEANVMGDRDQVALVLHGPQRIGVEVDEQLLPGEALSRRHDHLVAAISSHPHPVRPLSGPARPHVKSRGPLQRRHVPHQQAVAGVRGLHHLIHLVRLGRDQVDHRSQLVLVPVAGMRPQRDPRIDGSAQPRVAGNEVVHFAHFDWFTGVVRPAQADQDVRVGLANGNPILEIELAGLLAAQRNGLERPEGVGVVSVHGVRHRPAGGVVTRQKMDIVHLHLAALHLRRPAARRRLHSDGQVLCVHLDGRRRCRLRRQEREQEQRQKIGADKASLSTHDLSSQNIVNSRATYCQIVGSGMCA